MVHSVLEQKLLNKSIAEVATLITYQCPGCSKSTKYIYEKKSDHHFCIISIGGDGLYLLGRIVNCKHDIFIVV